MLLVDAGDALFRYPTELSADQRNKENTKAELILACMGELGYAAMAVGDRDLVLGYDALVAKASAAKLPLLSANLLKGDRPAFEPRRIVRAGDFKVGLFAVSSAPDPALRSAVTRGDPIDAARTQVQTLRKAGVDLVVLLAHLDYPDAVSLLNQVPGIDLMIQAHTSRVAQPQAVGDAFLVAAGERGRQIVQIELDLAGAGKFRDLSEIADARQQGEFLDSQIAMLRKRVRDEPEHRAAFEQAIAQFEARKKDLSKVAGSRPGGGRTLLQSFVPLDAAAGENKKLRGRVEAFVARFGPTNQ